MQLLPIVSNNTPTTGDLIKIYHHGTGKMIFGIVIKDKSILFLNDDPSIDTYSTINAINYGKNYCFHYDPCSKQTMGLNDKEILSLYLHPDVLGATLRIKNGFLNQGFRDNYHLDILNGDRAVIPANFQFDGAIVFSMWEIC